MTMKAEEQLVEQFHKLYYSNGSRTWSGNNKWLGYNVLKCPLDLWIYQEIIFENKPDIIIEAGTMGGGTSLFLASMCDAIGNGTVISIDLQNTNHTDELPKHPRLIYVSGDSISDKTIEYINMYTYPNKKVMVILDTDHRKEHVLKELNLYSKLITKDQYLIVEDTNLNHPNPAGFEGPMEAIDEFLKENKDFVIDESKNKFYLTFNPNGYLKKLT